MPHSPAPVRRTARFPTWQACARVGAAWEAMLAAALATLKPEDKP